MPKPWHIFILLACGILGLVLYAAHATQHEPSYEGRTLSQWIESWRGDFTNPEGAAIRAIGTNGISYLLEWIRYEPPTWKATLYKATNKLLGLLNREPIQDKRMRFADKAGIALWLLGEQSRSAIPECLRLRNDPTVSPWVRTRASFLFLYHSTNATPTENLCTI